ncbi:MAG: flavin reductase family protein [Acidimicrobiia bacterium]
MIHDDNPFVDDPASRDPTRRFRGRLTAPVTIVTSGADDARTGLTVSSLLVVEGDPGRIEAVIGPTTDLWETVMETGRLVVHVCNQTNRGLAEVFAGLRPSPGGLFATVSASDSEWGPVLDDLADRAYCTFEERREMGYSGLVTATVDRVETGDLADPLVYFRGGYRSLR